MAGTNGATDPRAPVDLFTFFLELRRALPVPSGLINFSYVPADDAWEGWTEAGVAQLVGGSDPGEVPAGSVPHTAMAIRHLAEEEPAPLSRVEGAYEDWGMKGFIPEGEATIEVLRSVVALTRFVPRSAHPTGPDLTVRTLHRMLFEGLVHLNALLAPLGFVSDRWDLGPLTLADMPAEVAVLVDNAVPPAGEERQMNAFVTEIHDGYPVLAAEFEADESISREAIGMHGDEERQQDPFLAVFRLINTADGERLIGDHTRALVDLNTAVELLIGSVLYYGHAATDVPEEDARKANDAPLRRKVSTYLPALLGREIDLKDTEDPWGAWFSDGYLLRNRAVHEGEVLEFDAVERAFEQASALVADLRLSLEAVEPLAPLAEALRIEPRPSDERAIDQPLGIELPWDR
jgi:hypothetical protein